VLIPAERLGVLDYYRGYERSVYGVRPWIGARGLDFSPRLYVLSSVREIAVRNVRTMELSCILGRKSSRHGHPAGRWPIRIYYWPSPPVGT